MPGAISPTLLGTSRAMEQSGMTPSHSQYPQPTASPKAIPHCLQQHQPQVPCHEAIWEAVCLPGV